ncbi:hypothetical protein [Curtobacterium sp. ER1/6]|uniref:hypothetical protein n=1 Tax=Curtobacterium sp. ER1/6 TaxID=1891920 RepID=UPI00084FB6DE|nr:hypothetical protein [Curtobacterium sp. ER1/6]
MDSLTVARSAPRMVNVIGGLFYQGWYEDRSADETLELAFAYRPLTEREAIVREIDGLLAALPTTEDVGGFFLSFNVDIDFRRDLGGDVRAWLEVARGVVRGFAS